MKLHTYAAATAGILLLLVLQTPASAWWFRWDNGVNANEQCYGVAIDPQGDVVAAGYYNPYGNNVLRVAKYAHLDGSVIWASTWDPGLGSDASDVATDSQGNIYVCGSYFDTDHDWVVVKYDPDGTELARDYFDSGNGDDDAAGVATDPLGNVIVVGWCKNSSGNNVWRVVKYSPSFDTLWTLTWDSGLGSDAQGVATDNLGCVYVCGSYFNPGTGDHDWKVMKYASDGGVLRDPSFDEQFQAGEADANGIAVGRGYCTVVGTSTASGTLRDWQVWHYDAEDLSVADKIAPSRPARMSDISCVPNPCRGVTRIACTLPGKAKMSAGVYDEQGAQMRVLFDGALQTHGAAAVTWDGCDNKGQMVSPGTYFIRLSTEDGREATAVVTVVR